MNGEWILFHLKEAHEELGGVIEEFEKRSDYDAGGVFGGHDAFVPSSKYGMEFQGYFKRRSENLLGG